MKKVFKGVTYLLLLVLIFVYLCTTGNDTNVFRATLFTGIPTIALLFTIPAFIMTILSLCKNNSKIKFLSEMFSLFASVFALASGVIAMFKIEIVNAWPAILLMVFALILSIFSAINVFKLIDEEKKEENQKA